jgi:5-formyltetrahydrofolate cyclo-ligase
MNKNDLRVKYIKIRENITEKEEKSKIIAKKLLSFDVLKEAKVIGIYVSMKNEVDTHNVINKLLMTGKRVCVPLINNDGTMRFIYIDSLENMIVNKFGTLEPSSINEIANMDEIEVMVMPGVCFDRYGNRIGFGKGYYDRYLEKDNHIKKIGIAFDEQVINGKINIEDFDIKYDYLFTESEDICI